MLGARHGRARGRHAIDRPGPRDHLRAGDGRPARRAARGHHVHRRRHRQDRLRQRHPFRPLDAARRHADGAGLRRGGGAGQGGGGQNARRARGRDRFHRRPVRHAQEQPAAHDLSTSRRRSTTTRRSRPDGKLHAKATFTGRIPAYPTGCAICEVEIDPDTGAIEIARYASIDDAGQAINPLILHGQVHGGIVQGVGQALLEDVVYGDGGQVLTGSFMDYALPRAHHVPSFDDRAHRGPDQGQSAAGQGRRRGRHHAGARGGDERDHGRAVGLRHRAHRHAGDAAPHLERDPGGEGQPFLTVA